MKKLLLIVIPLIVLLFGFKSKCANQADITNLQSAYQTKFGYSMNANNAAQIIDKWQSLGDVYCFILYSENQYHPNELPYSYTRVAFTSSFSDNGTAYVFNSNNVTQEFNSSTNTTLTWSSGGSISWNKARSINVGKWSDFHTVPIDWDTVYYSANILPPDLDITYRELSNVPIVEVPLNVDLIAEPQNVYVEIGAIFFCPDEVDAYSDNGVYTYHSLDELGFYETIIDKEDLVLASNASSSYIHLALNDAWNDVYDNIPISEIEWHTDPNYSSNLVNNMKSRFENLRKVCCFYGNELRLFVRYFVINNDTQFVVGSWRVWYSKTPNTYTDQTPTWYQPYISASGTTGTSTNTGSNTQQNPDVITIPPGSGDPTGIYYNPSTNITVGSNVPNYPDYPTIRSYNADNFLVQTMNYLDYLNNEESEKTLFGEFGHFLASLFVFIPGEIWTIIAVGFSLVIVVMFLKIL